MLICMHSTSVRISSSTHQELKRLAAELNTTVGETVKTVQELIDELGPVDVTWIYEQLRERLAGLMKKVNDRFLTNLNRFVENYDTLSESDAAAVLKEKMAIEKERETLKQQYTGKVAKVLPPKKALRYAQIETRVDNMLRREVYSLIPLAN